MSPAPRASYETVTGTGAGLLDARPDGKLLLTGTQAASMLDGQVSNWVESLELGKGCYATLLTNKGRMLADVRVLAREDGLLLLTERATLQTLFDRLRASALGWDAELHKRTLELARIELIGPGSDDIAATAGFTVPGLEEHDNTADAVRTALGLDLLTDAADEEDARGRLLAAGALPADESLAEVLRVELGRPRWGHELDEQTMPEEANLAGRAVSFKKGCYVGQETVARLHWKGKPNRHLRAIEFDKSLGSSREPVRLESDDGSGRELGVVATFALSPSRGPLALALLRREAVPGVRVRVGAVPGTVTEPGPVQ